MSTKTALLDLRPLVAGKRECRLRATRGKGSVGRLFEGRLILPSRGRGREKRQKQGGNKKIASLQQCSLGQMLLGVDAGLSSN